MNKVCETCDSRIRLNLCEGKDTEFKYCYRKSGNPQQTKDTIFQFNTIDELKIHIKKEHKYMDVESLTIDWEYGKDKRGSCTGLILCKYDYDLFVKTNGYDGGIMENHLYPEGWIYYERGSELNNGS